MQKNVLFVLLVVVCFGVGMRVLYSINHGMSNDEAMLALRSVNYLSVFPISTIDQMPVYFSMVDLAYRLFDIYPWTARLWLSIMTGVVILCVYCISGKQAGIHAGLLSAAMVAFSWFVLKSEQDADLIAVALVLVAAAVLIAGKGWISTYGFVLSALFAGTALLVKIIALFFLPYLVYLVYHKEKKWGRVIVFLCVSSGFLLPILLHDFLWYIEAGKVDIPLSGFLGLAGQDSLHLSMSKFSLTPGSIRPLKLFFAWDWLIAAFGVVGFVLAGRHQKWTYLLWLIPLLISFFSSHPKHYVFLPIVFAMAAGNMIRIRIWEKHKNILLLALGCFIVVLLFLQLPQFAQGNASLQVTNALKQLNGNFVIIDAKIYPAMLPLVLNPVNYVSTSFLYEEQKNSADPNASGIWKDAVVVSCESGFCARSKDDLSTETIDGLHSVMHQLTFNQTPFLVLKDKNDEYALYKVRARLPAHINEPRVNLFYGYPIWWLDPRQAIDYYSRPAGVLLLSYYTAKVILVLGIIITVLAIPLVIRIVAGKD